MREPKPFFRTQTKTWYVQLGKQQINLGRDEKAAWDKYHALMDERRRGIVKADDSVANVLNRHLTWARDNRAKATFQKKLTHLRSFGRYVGPKLKVSQLKPYHVQRWIDQDYSDGSDTYRHIAISEVQTALNWHQSDELSQQDAAILSTRCRLPVANHKPVKFQFAVNQDTMKPSCVRPISILWRIRRSFW